MTRAAVVMHDTAVDIVANHVAPLFEVVDLKCGFAH